MSTTRLWYKSSYSAGDGGDCVEIATDWRKSSHGVHIRDSKNPTGGALSFNQPAWASFLGHVKAHIPV
ncbi:DUF397 domain-containing protein [Streptomyces roseifaciens]